MAWSRGRFRRQRRKSLRTIRSRCRSAQGQTNPVTSFAKCTCSFRFPSRQTSQNGQQLDVRLSLTDATGHYDFYHAFAEPGQKLDFTVTAVGTSLLDMYVNNTLVSEDAPRHRTAESLRQPKAHRRRRNFHLTAAPESKGQGEG